MSIRLSLMDEEAARIELAPKLGVEPESISHVMMVDWITGEVLVFFHGAGRESVTMRLEPAKPAT